MVLLLPTVSAQSLTTFSDPSFSLQTSTFASGATVFVSASDGVTCCTGLTVTATSPSAAITFPLSDTGSPPDTREDTVFRGSFVLNNSFRDGDTILISVNFTKFSSASATILAEFSPPTVVSVSAAFDSGAVSLNWTPASDRSGIRHYILSRSTGQSPLPYLTLTGTSHLDRNIQDGTTYSYTVSAVDNVGNTAPPSPVVTVSTPDTTPPQPVSVRAAFVNRSVRLEWTAPTDNVGVVRYQLFRSTTPSFSSPLATVTQLSFTDTDLKDSQTLYYAVRAQDEAGNLASLSNTPAVTIDLVPPPAPLNPTATQKPKGSILLGWPAVPGAVAYRVYSSSFPITGLSGLEPTQTSSPAFLSSPSARTYYAITAVDASGNEGPPAFLTAVPDASPPAPPASLSADPNPDGSVTLAWEPSASEDVVEYIISRVSPAAVLTRTPALSFRAVAAHNIAVTYEVRAIDQAGNEGAPASAEATATDRQIILQLLYPTHDLSVAQSQVVVVGRADPDSSITILGGNSSDVVLSSSGDFVGYATLNPGANRLVIQASDSAGNINQSTVVVTSLLSSTIPAGDPLAPFRGQDINLTSALIQQLSALDPNLLRDDMVSAFFVSNQPSNLLVIVVIAILLAAFLVSHKKTRKDIREIVGRRFLQEARLRDTLSHEKHALESLFQHRISHIPKQALPRMEVRDHNTARETRDVTVLFADIRNFTWLSQKLGPEKTAEMLDMFYHHLAAAAYQFGGTVTEYVGDRLMAAFNLEKPDPDHPLKAVRAAFDMQKTLRLLNERLLRKFNATLEIGIGIHTGSVVAGPLGHPKALKYALTGDVVNYASKLADRARAGEILLHETVFEKVRPHIRATGPVHLPLGNSSLVAYRAHSSI